MIYQNNVHVPFLTDGGSNTQNLTAVYRKCEVEEVTEPLANVAN